MSRQTDLVGVTQEAGADGYVTNGSAKAWVNFDGSGTIAARDSFNVSSLTDNNTGDYTVNFASAFGAANYAFTAFGGNNGATSIGRAFTPNATVTTSAMRFRLVLASNGTETTDDAFVTNTAHGDLA